ncbi:TPA: hypothetical protein U2M59_001922 [Providencia stuartii]|nr:hypothetical protein [Providencia stuartii]
MVLTGLMIVQESCELVAEAGYMIACEFSGKSLATDSLAALLDSLNYPPFHGIKLWLRMETRHQLAF